MPDDRRFRVGSPSADFCNVGKVLGRRLGVRYDLHTLCPAQPRLVGIVEVAEQWRGGWLLGTMTHQRSIVVELSFEVVGVFLPGTQISYLGLHRGKKTLFEFQLGKICRIPCEADYERYVRPIIEALTGYRPMFVM